MVFEAVVYCIDNSDYMINGDISPSRASCQSEVVSKLSSSKISESPETTVGLITMAGEKSQVVIPFTREPGDVVRSLHSVPIDGHCDFLSSLKVAQLVLKNRLNKKQRQRIVMFVGSPLGNSEESLIKQGKILKKNSIALDIINFGLENISPIEGNSEKLKKIVSVVNSAENSHFIEVGETGDMADVVYRHLSVNNSDRMVDEDPELELALQMSLEAANMAPTNAKPTPADTKKIEGKTEKMADDDQSELAKAIAMSLAADSEELGKKEAEKKEIEKILGDKDFLEDLIDSLPDIDKKNIDIDEVMVEASGQKEEKSDESKSNAKDGKEEKKDDEKESKQD